MKKLLFSRQLDIVLLGVAALASQAEVPSPSCEQGMSVYYVTQAIGNGMTLSAPIVPASGAPMAVCGAPTDSGGLRVATPDGKAGVVGAGGFSSSYSDALAASIDDAQASAAEAKLTADTARARNLDVGQIGHECLGMVLPEDPPSNDRLRPAGTAPAASSGAAASAADPGRAPASASPPLAPDAPRPADPPHVDTPPDPIAVNLPQNTSGSPISQSNNTVVDTMQAGTYISDTARGNEIIDAATTARQAIVGAASDDQQRLADSYRNLSPDAMASYLDRAQSALGQAASVLENATDSSIDSSERARFHNYILNARDKAQLGLDAIHDDQQAGNPLGADSPFAGLLGAKDANPLAKSTALAAIFGPQMAPANAATNDSLINRMVMLSGLPDNSRAQTLRQLKLLEHPTFTLAGGTQVTLDLLHNGYILGGGPTAVDCSSFVSSVLPADVRRGRFTTLDFRAMWIYGRTREFPAPPRYTPDRAKLVKTTASAFTPIDVYSGESLAVGDILVYRLQSEPIGHVVIVRSYNPATLRAEIVEAAQSAGTVRERTLDLSPDPLNARRRILMPGLWALRIKPVSNQACYYREGARTPAGGGKPLTPPPPARHGTPEGTTGGAL